ncbi:MAG: hypothetical protein QOD41_3703, partial [Cryptosporangiaceae bacterium]|nr:hypothetical protein [Cryptosporangiaceae bacterium]
MDVISAGRPDGIPRRWRPRWARVARRRWPRAYLVAARVLVAAGVLAGAVALRAGAGGLWDPSVPVPDAPADAPFALLAQYGTDLVRYDYEGGDVRTRALPRRIAGNRVVPAEGWVTSGETVLVTEAGPGEVAAAVLSRGGRFERMLPDGVRVLPVPHGRGLWIVRADGPTGSTVQEYDLTGQPSGFAVPVPRSWRVSAALREVLVLSRPGEPALAFWTPGRGDPRPYPGGGRVVSAAPDAVLTECRPACGFTLLRP